MEKLEFIDENGEKTQFYVIEETRINGINYLLVSESDNEDEEAEAYILKDTSDAASEEAVYEFVEEDSELEVVGKVFWCGRLRLPDLICKLCRFERLWIVRFKIMGERLI